MSNMEAPYPAQLVGWVVWGKVRSLPWWPGQVMHPSKGPPEVRKMAAMKSNAGKLLVMFLGDNKYAFLPWESVVDFAENKERHSSTNYTSKYWKLGVEEAEELLARRAGLPPATNHEPVDFATKKTNFSSLAKAWTGSSASLSKQHNSAGTGGGRATERNKISTVQPESSKTPVLITSSPEVKAVVPAPKALHRASGVGTDDGRPKSIGGVMLEWARYMPQVTATRKGAELSLATNMLRVARRLARGEEPDQIAAADELQHVLQVLHSFALQRRLHGVDCLVGKARSAVAAATAAEAAAAASLDGNIFMALRAGFERSDSGAAGGAEESMMADAANGSAPLLRTGSAAALGADAAADPVVVQEILVISNATIVPIPARVVEALRKGNSIVTAAAGPAPLPPPIGSDGGGGGGGESHPAALASALTPADATSPAGKVSLEGGAVTEPSGGHAGAVAAEHGRKQPAPQPVARMQFQQPIATQERVTEVDVALRVNGKLLPHLHTGLLLWKSAMPGAQGGVLGCAQQQQQQPASDEPRKKHHDQQPEAAATIVAAAEVDVAERGKEGVRLPASGSATDGFTTAVQKPEAPAHDAPKREREQTQERKAGDEASHEGTDTAVSGIPGADGASATVGAEALPEAPDAAAAKPRSPEPMEVIAAAPEAASGGSVGAAGHQGKAMLLPPPAAPEFSAHNVAAASSAAESASLDLSRCLAPWLRGEVRITSWMVCGPRLLLVAVSADRKRDGGMGGMKREARLLLAEAKERRAASPGGPDDDVMDNNTGSEPQLKRRLRSATSPPAPSSGQGQAHTSAGGAGRKSSPPPPPPSQPSAAVTAAHTRDRQQQADGGKEGVRESGGGTPHISATGPAAAALMRSRMLQQKRLANAAEAGAASQGAGSGQPGGDASRSASSSGVGGGGGGGGGADGRASKKVKLVRFPGPASGANGAAPCTASRVSSGGLPAAAAPCVPAVPAAAGGGGAAAGSAADVSAVAPSAGPAAARRRVSYSQLMLNVGDEGGDDAQRLGGRGGGCVTANVGYSCSSYDADWDVSYPPWLPQPAQKGPFITVSHLLLHKNSQMHLHQSQQRHNKADQSYGNYLNHQHGAAYHQVAGGRGSAAMPTMAGAAQPSQSHGRHHHHHHHHHTHSHHHHYHHHHAQHHASGHPLPSPRYNVCGGAGGRATSRRSSGYEAWQRDEQEELPYPDRQVDGWSSDAGTGMDIEYGMAAAASASWAPVSTYGGATPGAVAATMPPTLIGAGNGVDGCCGAATAGSGACEQILLDIRVGDEADTDGPLDLRLSGAGDTAIAVTVHLPPRDSSNAVPSLTSPLLPRPFTGASGDSLAMTSTPQPLFHSQAVAAKGPAAAVQSAVPYFTNHPGSSGLLPAVTPFTEQQSTAPISPAVAAAAPGVFGSAAAGDLAAAAATTTPFNPAAAAAAAAAMSFGGMPPADVDLAVAAAILADRNMYVCESAAQKPNEAFSETAAQQPESGAVTPSEGATAGTVTDGGSGGEGTSFLPRPSLCEGEVVRLRQECDTLREQVKLRLAPGALDPLPQQQLPYAELVAQVSERILALAFQLPSLSGPTKQTFIQYSRTLMQEALACGQASGGSTSTATATATAAATSLAPQVSSGRSLAVARVAADLVRSAAAPGLPLHPEDRWAFINLAAELLRP